MTKELNFRKRPVVIQAVQWTGENLREVISFTDGPPDARSTHASMKWEEYCDLVKSDGLKIYTLEGKMSADVGDWIIKGVKGEHYPCKPDVFELTYEPARAQLPSQGGEAVEVVAWQDAENPLYTTAERRVMHDWAGNGYPIVELMTVAQHQRILAAQRIKTCIALKERNDAREVLTHPADQVADDLTMVKVSRELLQEIVELHRRRGVVLIIHVEQLAELLNGDQE